METTSSYEIGYKIVNFEKDPSIRTKTNKAFKYKKTTSYQVKLFRLLTLNQNM